jgi:hypothetical protein
MREGDGLPEVLGLVKQTVCSLIACCLLTGTAAADKPVSGAPVHKGIGIEVGAIIEGGHSQYAYNHGEGLSPDVQGIIIRDRNGMTSRMVIGLVIAIAGAMAESGPKSVESRSYVSGDYLVTETKTTYYSEEEKAEIRRNTSESIDGLFKARYSDFELALFSRDRFGRGDTSGYKTNFFVGDGKSVAFETGFGFGRANSLVDGTRVTWKYFGMPFRVSGLVGPVRASLTYEWNWLKYGVADEDRFVHVGADMMNEVATTSHPWRLELSTAIFKRVALSGGATAQTLKTKIGYFATAGIFF